MLQLSPKRKIKAELREEKNEVKTRVDAQKLTSRDQLIHGRPQNKGKFAHRDHDWCNSK